jgi:hypothetical protein
MVLGDRLRARQSLTKEATTSSSRRRRAGSLMSPANQVHARRCEIRCTPMWGMR